MSARFTSLTARFHRPRRDRRARHGTRCCPTTTRSSTTRFSQGSNATVAWSPSKAGSRITSAFTTASACCAAAPLYLKGNSHGEFVFDWSWARATSALRARLLPEASLRRALFAGDGPAPAGRARGRERGRDCARLLIRDDPRTRRAGWIFRLRISISLRRGRCRTVQAQRTGCRASTGSSTGITRAGPISTNFSPH